jgi:hypothetical protein
MERRLDRDFRRLRANHSCGQVMDRQFRTVAAPGSRLAISLSVSGGSVGRAVKRMAFRAAVASLGEPARSSIPPERFPIIPALCRVSEVIRSSYS